MHTWSHLAFILLDISHNDYEDVNNDYTYRNRSQDGSDWLIMSGMIMSGKYTSTWACFILLLHSLDIDEWSPDEDEEYAMKALQRTTTNKRKAWNMKDSK